MFSSTNSGRRTCHHGHKRRRTCSKWLRRNRPASADCRAKSSMNPHWTASSSPYPKLSREVVMTGLHEPPGVDDRVVIVGGGQAGAECAATLRMNGHQGSVTVLAEEN